MCLGAPHTAYILTAYYTTTTKIHDRGIFTHPLVLPWNERNQERNNFSPFCSAGNRARRTYTGDAAPPPLSYFVADNIEEFTSRLLSTLRSDKIEELVGGPTLFRPRSEKKEEERIHLVINYYRNYFPTYCSHFL